MISNFYNLVKVKFHKYVSSPVFTSEQITKLVLPSLLDALSIMFINMLITALISSSGESSVAAVNLVSPIFTLIICLLNGISAGGTVAVTENFGSGDLEKTKEAAGHILWLTFLVGTGLSLLLILFPRPILTFLYRGAEAEVMEKAVTYMVQGSFSLIIFTIYTGVFCILRGLGESQKCMYLSVVINVAYLLFSILFLNVLKLDIQGSAMAQILARAVGSGFAVGLLFLSRDMPIRMTPRYIFSFCRSILSSILDVSIPFGLEQIFLYGGNVVIASLTVPLGTTAIAINSIATSLFGLITAAGMAACNLSVTVVGRCIGAREKEHAFRYGYKAVILALVLLVLSALVFYPLLDLMLGTLYTVTEEVRLGSLHLLSIILIPTLLFWPMSNVMPYVLRAAHDTVFPSVLALISMWGVRIAVGYLLAFPCRMGLTGLWSAMWMEWAVRTLILTVRFLRRKWLLKADRLIHAK